MRTRSKLFRLLASTMLPPSIEERLNRLQHRWSHAPTYRQLDIDGSPRFLLWWDCWPTEYSVAGQTLRVSESVQRSGVAQRERRCSTWEETSMYVATACKLTHKNSIKRRMARRHRLLAMLQPTAGQRRRVRSILWRWRRRVPQTGRPTRLLMRRRRLAGKQRYAKDAGLFELASHATQPGCLQLLRAIFSRNGTATI